MRQRVGGWGKAKGQARVVGDGVYLGEGEGIKPLGAISPWALNGPAIRHESCSGVADGRDFSAPRMRAESEFTWTTTPLAPSTRI